MPSEVYVGRYPFLRQVPAFRLLQAARLALSPGSVVISTLASLLFLTLTWVLGNSIDVDQAVPVASEVFEKAFSGDLASWRSDLLNSKSLLGQSLGGQSFLWPWESALYPAVTSLSSGIGWGRRIKTLVLFLIALGLWSIVGTVLCRRTAVLFASEDKSSMRNAIQYGLRRWHSSLMAPLTPLFAALIAGIVAAAYGLIGRLPLVGSLWLILGSPFVLLLAGAMAFLLLVTAVGWPLMVAAIATDDCDSFGALSRAYSGLTSKPWYALGFLAVGLVTGMILMSVVSLFAETTIWCAMSSVAAGSGRERAQGSLLMPLTILVSLIVHGVGASYFWSATTISYLLLRQQVDGVPVDQVAVDDESRPVRDPLPVVGMPATDARASSNGESFSRHN